MDKPFEISDKVHYFYNTHNIIIIKGIIIDGYYQERNKYRREGWRVMIKLTQFPTQQKPYIEKYLDEVTLIN